MLSKYVSLGDKIELQKIGKLQKETSDSDNITYYSRVHNVIEPDRMEITMPMEKTKLMILEVDEVYDAVFYANGGLYQCFVRIIDRYKSNNVILLLIELTSNLRKFQRREYYRFNCVLEMSSRKLIEKELEYAEKHGEYLFEKQLPLERGIIVDISGGGMRFIAGVCYEAGSILYSEYRVNLGGETKEFHLVGRVLRSNEAVNKHGVYEHRLQFLDIKEEEREDIIKYIFQEERKSRKKENGF